MSYKYRMEDMARTADEISFFRNIDPDFYEGDGPDGEDDAPMGSFGLVKIDTGFRAAWADAYPHIKIPSTVADRVYLVTVDNNGIVWAEIGADDKETAVEYELKRSEYVAWASTDEVDEDTDSTDGPSF